MTEPRTTRRTRSAPDYATEGKYRHDILCLAVIARDHGVSYADMAATLRRLEAYVALDIVQDLQSLRRPRQ